jgi:hypothetical protein
MFAGSDLAYSSTLKMEATYSYETSGSPQNYEAF